MNEKKEDIIKIYKNKVKLLKDHNNSYYSKDSPKISDRDYDKLKHEVIVIEKKYKFI